jgi:hypothetical protein
MEDKLCPSLISNMNDAKCRDDCAWRIGVECAIHVIGMHFLDVPIGEIPEECLREVFPIAVPPKLYKFIRNFIGTKPDVPVGDIPEKYLSHNETCKPDPNLNLQENIKIPILHSLSLEELEEHLDSEAETDEIIQNRLG